jgi:1,4-dihydroxy-2-naphthoate octaprenyltransferase
MALRPVVQHLRFPFSFLLLPVYLFALATVPEVDGPRALAAFLLIHLVLYPSSNAYNGLQDQDTGPVGGIARPLPAPRALWGITLAMDVLGTLAAFAISYLFGALFLVYVIFSRLYSYRGIRLKKYPIGGYITVALAQGALTYWMSYHAIDAQHPVQAPWQGMLITTLLIGAFYPITQIYQHEQDRADGVITLSARLGVRGTFLYCAVLYGAAFGVLGAWFANRNQFQLFLLLLGLFTPVLVWFLLWWRECSRNPAAANHRNTMQMSWRAAVCTNAAFFILFLVHRALV